VFVFSVVIENQMKEMTVANLKSAEELIFDRAKFLVSQALDLEEDSIDNDEETIKLYTEAVQLCIEAVICSKLNTLVTNY